METAYERKPPWLKVRLPSGPAYQGVLRVVETRKLNTVCQDAICPNIAECWGRGTCTFMILGDICTRACRFCAVKSGKPTELDRNEPDRVASAVEQMKVRYAVITSVNRDDLEDGGSEIFARTVRRIREVCPETRVELLTPDFEGRLESIRTVTAAGPDVFAHNIETVRRLTPKVRHRATYERSLRVLEFIKKENPRQKTKSGIQVGHGETAEDLVEAFEDLARIGVDILTIGQYLRPTRRHLPVRRYYTPEEFGQLRLEALRRGIRYCFSGPLVRSSYRAEHVFLEGPHRETVQS
jgi:lipoic acid synthetase